MKSKKKTKNQEIGGYGRGKRAETKKN